jgi:hypothetical protein
MKMKFLLNDTYDTKSSSKFKEMKLSSKLKRTKRKSIQEHESLIIKTESCKDVPISTTVKKRLLKIDTTDEKSLTAKSDTSTLKKANDEYQVHLFRANAAIKKLYQVNDKRIKAFLKK